MNVNVLTESLTVLTYLKPLNMHQKKRRNCSNCLQGCRHTQVLSNTQTHTHSVSSGSLRCLILFQSVTSNSLVSFKQCPFLLLFFLLFPHALLVRGKSYIRDQRQVCLSQTLSLLLTHTHMTIWCHSRSLTHSNWGKLFSSWALKSPLIQSSSIRNTSWERAT